MENWHVTVELKAAGALDDETMEAVTEGWTSGTFLESGRLLLRGRVKATNSAGAHAVATAKLTASPPLAQLLDAGTVTGPHRVTVTDEATHVQGLLMVGMGEAAQILGVSPGYLRKLRASDPDFPKPGIELKTGDVFHTADIVEYDKRRERGKPGRPPKAAKTA